MIDHPKPTSNAFKDQTDILKTCVEVGKLLTSTLNLQETLEVIMLKVSQLIRSGACQSYGKYRNCNLSRRCGIKKRVIDFSRQCSI